MKNRILILLVICLYACNHVNAQFLSHGYSKDLFQDFLKTKKTYVLKMDNKEVDDLVASAMKQFWKVTPYEIVSKEEIFERMYDPSYSFLLPASFSISSVYGNTSAPTTNFVSRNDRKKPTDLRHKDDPKYHAGMHDLHRGSDGFLAVVLGGPNKYNMGDMVAFYPFDVEGGLNWANVKLYNGFYNQRYRIKDMIAGINRSIELQKENKYEFQPDNCMDYFFDNVYKDAGQIKDKTLYVLPFLFGNDQTEDLKKLYPYKYKEVDIDEYMAAINEEKEGVVYLFLSYNTPAGIYLVDAHEHKTLGGKRIKWFNQDRKTLDAGDLKKVVDLIANAK